MVFVGGVCVKKEKGKYFCSKVKCLFQNKKKKNDRSKSERYYVCPRRLMEVVEGSWGQELKQIINIWLN